MLTYFNKYLYLLKYIKLKNMNSLPVVEESNSPEYLINQNLEVQISTLESHLSDIDKELFDLQKDIARDVRDEIDRKSYSNELWSVAVTIAKALGRFSFSVQLLLKGESPFVGDLEERVINIYKTKLNSTSWALNEFKEHKDYYNSDRSILLNDDIVNKVKEVVDLLDKIIITHNLLVQSYNNKISVLERLRYS